MRDKVCYFLTFLPVNNANHLRFATPNVSALSINTKHLGRGNMPRPAEDRLPDIKGD